MARIRTIKPEFFTSEDIVSMTPLARLFYVSLWCEADREGRLAWKPRTLKMRYLPGDDCSIDELSAELIDSGLIVIYTVDGKEFAEIPGFVRHQVINNRESESVIPPRVDDASGTRQARVKAEGKEGREGKGKEGKDASSDADDEQSEISIPLKDGSDYCVGLAEVAELEMAYPLADVAAELRKARAWCVANASQRKTRSGMPRFLNGWVSRAIDDAAKRGGTVGGVIATPAGGGRKLL